MEITRNYDIIKGNHGLKIDLNNNKVADKKDPDFYLTIANAQGQTDPFWQQFMDLQNIASPQLNIPNEVLQKFGAVGEHDDNGFISMKSLEKAFTQTDENGNVTEKFVSASAVLNKKDAQGSLIITVEKPE